MGHLEKYEEGLRWYNCTKVWLAYICRETFMAYVATPHPLFFITRLLSGGGLNEFRK